VGAQGTATIDFGAFPGKTDASVDVTGQAAIVAGSLVEAWIRPVATADHTADEHMVDTIKVFAGNIVAGTGFTIYGFVDSEITEPLEPTGVAAFRPGGLGLLLGYSPPSAGGKGMRLYGVWQLAWVWN
jgi:hypothetical protein